MWPILTSSGFLCTQFVASLLSLLGESITVLDVSRPHMDGHDIAPPPALCSPCQLAFHFRLAIGSFDSSLLVDAKLQCLERANTCFSSSLLSVARDHNVPSFGYLIVDTLIPETGEACDDHCTAINRSATMPDLLAYIPRKLPSHFCM